MRRMARRGMTEIHARRRFGLDFSGVSGVGLTSADGVIGEDESEGAVDGMPTAGISSAGASVDKAGGDKCGDRAAALAGVSETGG